MTQRAGIEGVEKFMHDVNKLDDEIGAWVGKIHARLHMAAHGGVQNRIRPVRDTGDTEARVGSWLGMPTGSSASAGSPEGARARARATAARIQRAEFIDSGVELNVPWGGKLEQGRKNQRPLGMFVRTHQSLFRSGLVDKV